MGAGNKWLRQIGRIFHRSLQNKPLHAVRLGDDVKIFRHYSLVAIGNAVLAQVSGFKIGGDDFQGPAWSLGDSTSPRGRQPLPGSNRITLQTGSTRRSGIEAEPPC